MTTVFDPGDDFPDVVDGTQAVVLIDRDGTEVPVDKAWHGRVQTVDAVEGDGKLRQVNTTWHLTASSVSTQPALGAAIVDGGGARWTILEVLAETQGARFACRARRLEITGGKETRVTIQQATHAKGAHGSATAVWKNYKVGVPATIRPLSTTMQVENDLRQRETLHAVYFLEDLPLSDDHRLFDAEGNAYRVQEITSQARLAAAMRVVVRQIDSD